MNTTTTKATPKATTKSSKTTTKADARIAPLVSAYKELMALRGKAEGAGVKAAYTRKLKEVHEGLQALGYDVSKLEPISTRKAAAPLPMSASAMAALASLKSMESDTAA